MGECKSDVRKRISAAEIVIDWQSDTIRCLHKQGGTRNLELALRHCGPCALRASGKEVSQQTHCQDLFVETRIRCYDAP